MGKIGLPVAPPVSPFIQAIRKLKDAQASNADPGIRFMAELFETDSDEEYSISSEHAYKCVSYYLEVCDLLGTQFKDCDGFFVGFGRLVLSEHALLHGKNEKVKLLDYRKCVGAALHE